MAVPRRCFGIARRHVPQEVDLDWLHALLGHYARQLWDVQKERIAAGNRVAAIERDGLGEYAGPARDVVTAYEKIEGSIDRVLVSLVKQHPLAGWIGEQRGIGLPGFARLLGVTGSLDRFGMVSSLWKYLGLHVVDGHAPRREKGVPWTHTNCTYGHLRTCTPSCTTDHHPDCSPGTKGSAYAPQGRVVCAQIGDAIVKVGAGGPYRAAYDRKKGEYLARPRIGPSGCPMGQTHKSKTGRVLPCVKTDASTGAETSAHLHSAARRYAMKELTKGMWVEWQYVRGRCDDAPHDKVAAPVLV